MLVLPIQLKKLYANDDIAESILHATELQAGDIVVIASKAIARTEGAALNLQEILASKEAEKLGSLANQSPQFSELVLRETKRMNGDIIGTCPYAILTSLKPNGMRVGRILCPNAGLDLSNIEEGQAIGWPVDPVRSADSIRNTLERSLGGEGKLGVIISDSCCTPGRLGVIAFALATAGVDPIRSEVGKTDLFGSAMRMTKEAVADQLAIAANAVMGNTSQSIPAALIRDSGVELCNFLGWVDGIEAKDDLYQGVYPVIR